MFDAPGQLRAVVVDDDSDVRLLIRRTLEMQGFAVIEAASGAEALLSINEHQPDIVTLDLNLPDLDGVEVCRRLRKFSDAYVFMITARVDEIDELIGLETGADDFIGKPFSPRTVQARVSAALRRHRPTPQRPTPQRRATDFLPAGTADRRAESGSTTGSEASRTPQRRATDVGPATAEASPSATAGAAGRDRRAPAAARTPELSGVPDSAGVPEPAGVLRHGPLVVEPEARTATLDGAELVLTRTEFDLLESLTGAPRRVWTRKALLTKVWGNEWAMDEHLVEVHIGNLRRKLGDKGREPRFIRTVRGVGYRMAPAEEVV
ncbi:Alkaline phosphatase synthesis transcriptional regulatory protein PhoP [Arthrobacter sp. SO5]|uniref:response regulator transcription factor n=1 Tax=Arthrobacter sp. SO5 TaxID=1897055 RepID=UPI001E44E9EA|nr:response regulator transcription factor [Arthrobacter sp. SO5]MCB5273923.1 Alkaline phosphatase synthesis transcriptional regulatory protein PhoP [Arthrobacter sp. SO5]